MSEVSFDLPSIAKPFSLGSPPLVGVVPYIGTHFDPGTGFNMNYVGALTVTPGQDPTPLSTETANFLITPVTSPDGSKIAWKQQGALWVINPDGTGETNIEASTNGAIYAPLWHPDSSKILYVKNLSSDGVTPDEIRTIAPDGTGETTLFAASNATTDFLGDASYNFDGSKIAFSRLTGSTKSLYVMNADGTGASLIASLPTGGIRRDSPTWAWLKTQSKLIAVTVAASTVRTLMNDDGTGTLALDSGTTRRVPEWANVLPDDSAYVTSLSTGAKLVTVAMDGSGATDLLDVSALSASTTSGNAFPLGGRIYWDSGDDIWSCLPDGSDARNESASTLHNLGLTG